MSRSEDKISIVCTDIVQEAVIHNTLIIPLRIQDDARERFKIKIELEYAIFLAAAILRITQKERAGENWDMKAALRCWKDDQLPESIERVRKI